MRSGGGGGGRRVDIIIFAIFCGGGRRLQACIPSWETRLHCAARRWGVLFLDGTSTCVVALGDWKIGKDLGRIYKDDEDCVIILGRQADVMVMGEVWI